MIRRTDMRKFAFIILALLALVGSCACKPKERELPVDPDPVFQRYCQDLTFESTVLRETVRYSVYLPANYTKDKDKRYSVVYMLHGYGDNNNSWNGKYLHANERINYLEYTGMSEMIYVFPFGKNSYYSDTYDGKYKYMKMFVTELIPLIDKSLRTIPDREHRSITGYSMGGFGAMVLPEKHPELFLCSAPLSMSFRTDAQYMAESQSGWNNQWGCIFGGVGEAGVGRLTQHYKNHCPFYQFTPGNKEALSQVHWFFTCGDDEEQLLIANDSLHVQLRDNGYDHEFRVGDGAHTSTYWMTALTEVLPMFDYYMNKGGKKWDGINREIPDVPSVDFAEDGTLPSASFSDGGTGVFVAYDGLEETLAKDVMAYIFNKNANAVILPCDISRKSLAEWMSLYEGRYSVSDKQALAIGDAGEAVWTVKDKFSRLYLIDTRLGENVIADAGRSYYFATTDNGVNYHDMARLYKSCKKLGKDGNFEYRVIKGYDDLRSNILKSIQTIKPNFIY